MTPSESDRLAALQEYQILDTPPELAFDRITALAAELFDTPIALVSLIDADRQWFKSAVGLDVPETPREYAFCDHTIRSNEVLVVPDAELDARFRDTPLVTGDPLIRFYAGAPLCLPSGHRVGSLCVIDRKPREGFDERQKRRLAILAQIVVNEMELRISSERLALARKQADAANAAKSEFLANMSHEVRTPMNGVIGFGDLLLRTELTEEQRRYAALIVESGGVLLKLLNDILDLSKIEAGRLELADEPFDVRHVLEPCAQLMTAPAAAKGLRLETDIDPTVPPWLVGDPLRLRQIVLNLLGNAVKFTLSGAVTLGVRLGRRRVGGDRLLITVADTGIGIPADKLDLIFEKFTQADASIGRRFGGTGLGLSISQRLAELMGGELELESEVGKGTRVTVRLPLKTAAAPPAAGAASGTTPGVAPPAVQLSAPRAAHVLLAEDLDINRELGVGMLRALGHSVETAADGGEALRLFGRPEGEAFDLILMDVNMPGVDGLQATRAIRALGGRGAKVPILALTASTFPEEIARCLAAGMDDHLAKPITQDRLGQALARWLAGRAAPSPAPPEADAMTDLAAKFLARKRQALAVFEAALQAGGLDQGRRAEVQGLAHQLAGVAGVFGEAELGELARGLDEAALSDTAEATALRPALERLVRDLRKSLAAAPAGPS